MEADNILFHSQGTPRARWGVYILFAALIVLLLYLLSTSHQNGMPDDVYLGMRLAALLLIPLPWVWDRLTLAQTRLTLYEDHLEGTQSKPLFVRRAPQANFSFPYREVSDVQYDKKMNILTIRCHGENYIVCINAPTKAYALLCEKIYGRK